MFNEPTCGECHAKAEQWWNYCAICGHHIAATGLSDWPADYQSQFWNRYPNKKAKALAVKALDKVAKAGKTRWVDLINGLERYIYSYEVQKGFVKHPATWINGGCWQDQEQTTPLPVEKPKSFFEVASDLMSAGNGERTNPDRHQR